MPNPLLLPLLNWARKLRYPVLFKLTAALFAISVLLPPGIDPRSGSRSASVAVSISSGRRNTIRMSA